MSQLSGEELEKQSVMRVINLIKRFESIKSENWSDFVSTMDLINKVLMCSVISLLLGMGTSIYFDNYNSFWFLVVIFYFVNSFFYKFSISNTVKNIFNEEKYQVHENNNQDSEHKDDSVQESKIRKIVQLHLKYKKIGKSLENELKKEI